MWFFDYSENFHWIPEIKSNGADEVDASGLNSGVTYGVGPGNNSGEGPDGASIGGSADEPGVDSGLFAVTYKSE